MAQTRSHRTLGRLIRVDLEVSVVIPHFGDPAPTAALIESLQAQVGVAIEVIVSDDYSPVALREVLGARVIRRETNGGFGSAVNSGAAVATAPLLLILNSDVTIGETFVRDLLAEARPWMPAVCGPLTTTEDGGAEGTAHRFPTAYGQGVQWTSILARLHSLRVLRAVMGEDTHAMPGAVEPVDWLVGAALLLPRDHFAAVGGFDERFYMNSEEVDLQRRLRARGLPSVFIGTVALIHTGGGSTDPKRSLKWLMDSRLTYAEKWGFRGRLRSALTAATAMNLVTNSIRKGLGRPTTPLATAREEWRLITGRPERP